MTIYLSSTALALVLSSWIVYGIAGERFFAHLLCFLSACFAGCVACFDLWNGGLYEGVKAIIYFSLAWAFFYQIIRPGALYLAPWVGLCLGMCACSALRLVVPAEAYTGGLIMTGLWLAGGGALFDVFYPVAKRIKT